MKLSIIIPVYNVERYLNQCLKSIKEQWREGTEIILIDDGSTDSSSSICNQWANNCTFIKVIHQQNQGLSMARNKGLELATGKYVWFVDSDDWILPNALDDIYAAIEHYPQVDVFSSYMRKYYEKNKQYKNITSKSYGHLYTGIEYMKAKLPDGASQRFIHRREFLMEKNIRFYPNVLHEDGIWGKEILYQTPYVLMLSRSIYVYRIRTSGSIMSNLNIKSAYDNIKCHKELIRFMDSHVESRDKSWFVSYIFTNICSSIIYCTHIIHTHEFHEFMKKNYPYMKQQAYKAILCNPFKPMPWIMILNPYLIPKSNKIIQNTKRILKRSLYSIKKIIKV